ncbi:MAG: hypothetical protein QOG72_2414 [Sphingomonadales bacterium]|jgi:hypothetical protein|nr:hypothetical protein [Sphingomonadales bacterium]
MATETIPYLRSKTSKSGRTSWFWEPSAALKKAGWTGVAYGPDRDSAFERARRRNEEVALWKEGGARPAAVRAIVRQVTVAEIVDRYKAAGWPSVEEPGKFIAASTRGEYASKLRKILAWARHRAAGDVPIAAITPERVAVLRDELMKPRIGGRYDGQVCHTAAHATLRVGRTLFTYAEQSRLIPKGSNPFADFGLASPDKRELIWWEPAREALIETAQADPDMAVAIDLAYSIGQRESDLLRLVQSQYVEIPAYKMDADVYASLSAVPVPATAGQPGYLPGDVRGIRVRQSKGKRWVEVPIVGAVRARVEASIARARACGCTTLLVDRQAPPEGHWAAKGWQPRPWTAPDLKAGQRRFIRRFAELRAATIERLEAAGDDLSAELAREIAELQYRDFRRTAVVVMGELGIPDHLIAAITGHDLDETKRILDTYMPRTTGMAARAIALSHARQSTTLPRAEVRVEL